MLTAERLRELLVYEPVTGVFRWRKSPARRIVVGSVAAPKTQKILVDGKMYKASRLAWLYMTGQWPKFVVDHGNRNPKDNRWENLRDVTQRINMQNTERHPNNTSGRKGVSWDTRRSKWVAHITLNYRFKFLGYFSDKEAAIEARKAAEKTHFLVGADQK